MIYIILILITLTISLILFVTTLCIKYIKNLSQTIVNLKKQNTNLQQKIIILNKYWKEFADAREQNFINKLQLFEISERDKILVNNYDKVFLTIPCHNKNSIHYQKTNLNFQLNIVDMDYDHIEEILCKNLANYLIKENFIKGKYKIKDNSVEFIVPIMTQIY